MRIIISVILLLSFLVNNGQRNETELENAISEILNHINNKNWSAINSKYVDTSGLYFFYPIGAYVNMKKIYSIEECLISPSIFSADNIFQTFSKKDISRNIIKDSLSFTCDKGWNKKGLFIEKRQDYLLMTNTMRFLISADVEVNYSEADFEKALDIEKKSMRVILTQANLIFHLKRVKNRWKIIFIDQITTNCDA